MDYKQYKLEELQSMFDKEQNPEELNKIMSVIVDKTRSIIWWLWRNKQCSARRRNLSTNEFNQVRRP